MYRIPGTGPQSKFYINDHVNEQSTIPTKHNAVPLTYRTPTSASLGNIIPPGAPTVISTKTAPAIKGRCYSVSDFLSSTRLTSA